MVAKGNSNPPVVEPPDYQIRWKNFRAFRDTNWVTLRPLTVLIGPNNAGKTSVITPLLLLNQTVLSDDIFTPLVTKGSLVDCGTFQNIVRDHDVNENLFFGLRFHSHDYPPKPLKKLGSYPPGALELTFSGADNPYSCVLKKYEVYDAYQRRFLKRVKRINGNYSTEGMATAKLRKNERDAIATTNPVNFMFSAARDIYKAQTRKQNDRGFKTEFSPQFNHYLAIVSYVFTEVRSLLHELSYIGPIRERARHYYEITAESPRTVGPSGERTPNLLRARYSELKRRLNTWVRAFELGDQIQLNDIADGLFEINFERKKPFSLTNIADAGFGASQVLPLIVQALASKKGSLTIAEQPEIHLNPRLQGVLADLFVEMANSERRIIVETHSEHLVLRLRTLLAQGKIDRDRVALYFVEKDDQEESKIRLVPIQGNGRIKPTYWPKGFFADTVRESLALAQAQFKSSQTN